MVMNAVSFYPQENKYLNAAIFYERLISQFLVKGEVKNKKQKLKNFSGRNMDNEVLLANSAEKKTMPIKSTQGGL